MFLIALTRNHTLNDANRFSPFITDTITYRELVVRNRENSYSINSYEMLAPKPAKTFHARRPAIPTYLAKLIALVR